MIPNIKALSDYVDRSCEVLMRIHPDWDEKMVQQRIWDQLERNIKDPPIVIEDDFKRKPRERKTLLWMCDYIDKEKPIIAGNATLYCQPEVLRSPTSLFLKEKKLARGEVKKKMFTKEPGSNEYILLDLESGNIKIIMNADYGASGNEAAAWWNKYAPAAITLMAQSIITTAAAFFEGFCGDNQVFFHINEAIDWMEIVIKKDYKIDKWLRIPNSEEVYQRILKKFQSISPKDCKFLRDYIYSLNSYQLTLIYYANNIRALIAHPEVYSLFDRILSTLPALDPGFVPEQLRDGFQNDKEWYKHVAKAMFLDPYGVPECIKDDLKKLQNIAIKYVFVEYLTPDSIEKLNNHLRNTVLLVDTDSNGIYLGRLVKFILEDILHEPDYGREKMYDEMIIVSCITSILSIGIAKILNLIGIRHNLNEEARKELTMKNEFLWISFFVMMLKKHYGALVALREGNIFIPFKMDIKGMEFTKAAISKEVNDKFEGLLNQYILSPEEPDLRNLMRELKRFEREILNGIEKGSLKYFKTQTYKPFQAYGKRKNALGEETSIAWTQQVFKGSEIWNLLDDEHPIASLDRVYIVKTIIESIDDLGELQNSNPELYERIRVRVYNNEHPQIVKSGMSIICVPPSLTSTPEWLIPYINKELIVSNIMSSFSGILEAFGITNVKFKTPNSNDAKKLSGLISL